MLVRGASVVWLFGAIILAIWGFADGRDLFGTAWLAVAIGALVLVVHHFRAPTRS